MRYPALFAADLVLAVLVVAGTIGAAWGAAAGGRGRGETAARWVPGLLLVTCVLVATRAAAGVAMAAGGGEFAIRRLGYHLPLVAVPLLAAVTVWSVRGRMPGRILAYGPALVATAAASAALALLDLLLLPGPVTAAALTVVAVAGPVAAWWTARAPAGTGQAPGRPAAGIRTALRRLGVAVPVLLVVAGTGSSWWGSRLPGDYDLADYAAHDLGRAGGAARTHAAAHAGHRHPSGAVSVADLAGPRGGSADVRVTLTTTTVHLPRSSGGPRVGVAVNGQTPGPVISARRGQLVEVILRNADVTAGVTLHWHGYDVPNAEDGVAGVTQDAVPPGGSHTYRFRAGQVGTFWYHAHQVSSAEVDGGLYGALIVTGAPGAADHEAPGTADLIVLDHGWRPPGGFLAGSAFDPAAAVERRPVAAGTPVRLRMVNTDNRAHRYGVHGTSFRLTAVDGTPVAGAAPVRDRSLRLAAGGRYDLEFTMPAEPVTVTGLGQGVRLLLGDPPAAAPGRTGGPDLDLLSYGSAGTMPIDPRGHFDREFHLTMDRKLGFADGRIGYHWAVNGRTYPRMPMLMVRQGDLVRSTLVNRTTADHPMHLHGHHMLVLSRNGHPATGAPWWTDTLNVAPGERYVVAFRADNPGIWMDHCHDLKHAADGFVMHLAYEGVAGRYRTGSDTPNQPE